MLHNDAWLELMLYLGASEIVKLFGVFDRLLLSRLTATGCIDSLALDCSNFALADVPLARFMLQCLPRLNKLDFAFSSRLNHLPEALTLEVFKALPRLHLKELNLTGSVRTHDLSKQTSTTLADLCPSLETFSLVNNYRGVLISRGETFLTRLPGTLTSYTGPEVLADDHKRSMLLPSSLTHLEVFIEVVDDSRDVRSVLSDLSSLQHLTVLRVHAMIQEARMHHRRRAIAPPPPYAFPLLTEFLYHDSGSTFATSLPCPTQLLDAPLLHTFAALLTANWPRLHPLPSTLTHLTIGTSYAETALEADLLLNLPPGLKVLRLLCRDVIASHNHWQPPSEDWFARLPAGLEELVASPEVINWSKLPPRLERLLCKSFAFIDCQHTFQGLARRSLRSPAFSTSRAAPSVLPSTLPATLLELYIGFYLPSSLLPLNIRSLAMEPHADMTIDTLQELVTLRPSLRNLTLLRAIALPSPKEDGSTTFDLSSYPTKLIRERFPLLPFSSLLDIKWVLRESFHLPSTLERLIVRADSPAKSSSGESKHSIETPCLSLSSRAVDSLLTLNLPRLPGLTHLEISAPHVESIALLLASLPKLQILRDCNDQAIPFDRLPPALSVLEVSINPKATGMAPSGLKFIDSSAKWSHGLGTSPSTASRSTGSSMSSLSDRPSATAGGTADKLGAHWQPSASPMSALACYEIPLLPSTLTRLNLGRKLLLPRSTIAEWPKGLRTLSFATNGSWCDTDALTLKDGLPSLETLELFGGVRMTLPLDYASPSLPSGSSSSSIASKELKNIALGRSPQPTHLSASMIEKFHIEHLRSQGILIEQAFFGLNLLSDLSPSFTSLDLLGAPSTTSPLLRTDSSQLSPSLLSLRLQLMSSNVAFDEASNSAVVSDPSSPVQRLMLPPRLTELAITSLYGPQLPSAFDAMPKTLRYLQIATTGSMSKPWHVSAETLSTLPQSIEALRLPYVTFNPTDIHALPPKTQLLSFAGGDFWLDTDLVLLSQRLAAARASARSAVFDDPKLLIHLIQEPSYPIAEYESVPNSISHLSRRSAHPPTLLLQCTRASFTGTLTYKGRDFHPYSISNSTSFKLFKKGVHVLSWSKIVSTLELLHPENIQKLQLHQEQLFTSKTLSLDSFASLPQLPQMTALRSLSLSFNTVDFSSLFSLLTTTLTSLTIASQIEFEWSTIVWSRLPRGLLELNLLDHPKKRIDAHEYQVTDLPPSLKALNVPGMAFAPGSVPNLPSSMRSINCSTDITSEVRAEWQSRRMNPNKIVVMVPIKLFSGSM